MKKVIYHTVTGKVVAIHDVIAGAKTFYDNKTCSAVDVAVIPSYDPTTQYLVYSAGALVVRTGKNTVIQDIRESLIK